MPTSQQRQNRAKWLFSLPSDLWKTMPVEKLDPYDTFYLVAVGFLVGFCAAFVVAIFRITSSWAYSSLLKWTATDHRTFLVIIVWIIVAAAAGLIVGQLVKNPAISFGGGDWIRASLKEGQPHAWRVILIPKFVGSWLVAACGVSVGREGPSIQMGCATALGLKNFNNKQKIERRFFICGGCAAGLASIFGAPFSGICWVYEMLKERMTSELFLFMLAGSFGVYVADTGVFGLGGVLPIGPTPLPDFGKFLLFIPLGIFAACVGIAYNYLLRISIRAYSAQKKIPVYFQPMFAFGGAALLVLIFPAITGEGMTIFPPIEAGRTTAIFLCIFLLIKLLFTAYCYGSRIPAGVMVPVLCVGGVMGAIYGDWTAALGLLGHEYFSTCIVLGMAGAFAAAERAPVTGLVLVAQTTGSYEASLGLLFCAAIGAILGRVARVRPL